VGRKFLRSALVNRCGCGRCRICERFQAREASRRAQFRYDQSEKREAARRRDGGRADRRYYLRRKGGLLNA